MALTQCLTVLVPCPRIRFMLQQRADHCSGEGLSCRSGPLAGASHSLIDAISEFLPLVLELSCKLLLALLSPTLVVPFVFSF